jgi:protein SCO1/2
VRRLPRLLLCVALAVLAACGGGASSDSGEDDDGWRGLALSVPWAKPDFVLTGTDGRPFDFPAETDGYLTLLFFGYTNCPDVCPLHLANLAAVLDAAGGDVRANTKVVFATTDPARDTGPVLEPYLAGFDPSFIGLTGTPDEVVAAQQATGIAVAGAEPPEEDGSYVVGHAAQVIAYTRDGLAHVVYPFGTRQEDWAEDLPRLLAEPAWNPSPARAG